MHHAIQHDISNTYNIKDAIQIALAKKKSNKHSNKLEYGLRFQKYLTDIEDITGRPIPLSQRKLIKQAIENNNYHKLSSTDSHKHRADFNKKRKDIIAEWELNTGQEWPKYKEPVYSKNGEMIRRIGQNYEAHHICECSWGGNNEWWNMHPAKFPSEHQNGIHRKGGYCDQIFNT